MCRVLLLVFLVFATFQAYSQESVETKKEFQIKKPNIKLKKPNLRIGEKLGKLAGNAMTGKTAVLGETTPVASMISGIYDPATKTSESKYFPKGTRDGDYLAGITFMKNEGVGMLNILGEVTCDGNEMEYVGLGSYMYRFNEPVTKPKTIKIVTETGDEAFFNIMPVPEIEIISVNGDVTQPIIDLTEDMRIKFTATNPTDKSIIKVGLISDVAGARAVNWFADFTTTKEEVIIPHQAFSNLEISGALNTGNVNKGETFIVIQRELVVEKSGMDANQDVKVFDEATSKSVAYASKKVIVKGKQENGVIAVLSFSGGHKKVMGFDIHKPNARTGIPFSRASNFGLLSLTINGETYKKETSSGSSSSVVGNTRYTSSWTNTTTYQFPQLPDSHWDTAMDDFYTRMVSDFKENMGISFVPVDQITSAPGYDALFDDVAINTKSQISKTYKGTKRAAPNSIRELFSTLSSSKSTENPSSYLMKLAKIDGLVTMDITFKIGSNKENKVVLLPTIKFSITGMDETKGNRLGVYANGYITYKQGIPFDADLAKKDPNYLSSILNVDNVMSCMEYMLVNLKQKEVAMGYDAIWSIGE